MTRGTAGLMGAGPRLVPSNVCSLLAPSCGAFNFNSGFNYGEEGEHGQCLHSKSAGLSARNRKTKGFNS